jgi:hypothetical protein
VAAPFFAVLAPTDPLTEKFGGEGIVVRSSPTGFDVQISDGDLLRELLG